MKAVGIVVAAGLGLVLAGLPASAQSRETFGVQGFGMAGVSIFSASQTFDAVLGAKSRPILGGGLRLVVPAGPYLEVGAWRFEQDGERAFVGSDGEVFPLGIPTTVRMTPLEVTAGWRFGRLLGGRVTPHLGAGFTSMRYEETSQFADEDENVSERHNGFHVAGGAEVRLGRWVALSGDVVWTTIGGALGQGGASEVFDEDDLGGTSVRFRLILGR